MPETQRHYRTCSLCEAMCGIVIEHEGTQIKSIRGDKDDPFSQGHICPKAVALQDVQNDPDRLTRPVRRNGDEWEEISWDEAYREAIQGLRAVQERHGRHSIGIYQGNPTVHNYGTMLFGTPFFHALGSKTRFSATSVDQLPHHLAAYTMYGHQLLIPIPDIDRTDYMLILGANPGASNGSLMSAPGTLDRLEKIRKRGGTVVLVDPRRTETAKAADRHLFIRPGTDALLLLAILNVIFAEGLDRPGRLTGFTKHLDRVRSAAARVSPKMAATHTGIAESEIRALAKEFAGAKSAVCYGRFGVSTQSFGGLCQWLVNALNLVTGNVDREGGAMFTLPAVDAVGLTSKAKGGLKGGFARKKSRVRGLPEFGGEFPVATMAEEILTEGKGQIRGVVTSAGNPVLSTPNGAQLDDALSTLEYMVSIDFYINETTRHANIILPPTPPLEHDHYDLAFHVLAVRNTAKYSPPLFTRQVHARHDWEIFLGLMREAEKQTAVNRTKHLVLGQGGPKMLLDLALRFGPYGKKLRPFGGLSLKKLRKSPHGIDFGPLKPMLPKRLLTKDKKIDAAPDIYIQDVERLLATFSGKAPKADGQLLLIGRRHIRSNNSWMHNVKRLVRGKDRCTVLIHPEDAGRHGIADGKPVRVTSRAGSVEAAAEVSDVMMPGVVSLPHGWGHNREGIREGVAAAHPGVSLNDVTDEMKVDGLVGTAVLNGVPVTIAPA